MALTVRQNYWLVETRKFRFHLKLLHFAFLTSHIISGQTPANPRLGFLPPNPENGTDGQGFITYSIEPLKNAPSRSVIDAKASIIFDQNKPIDTPPIFNTVSFNETMFLFKNVCTVSSKKWLIICKMLIVNVPF